MDKIEFIFDLKEYKSTIFFFKLAFKSLYFPKGKETTRLLSISITNLQYLT